MAGRLRRQATLAGKPGSFYSHYVEYSLPTGGEAEPLQRIAVEHATRSSAPPRGATLARLTLQEKIDAVTRLQAVHESLGEVDPDVIQLQHDVDELLARGLWLLSTEANDP